MLFPLSPLDEGSLSIPNEVLSRPVDVILLVIQEFDPMSNPTGHTGNREQNRIHIGGETHCPVDQPRIEINIRVQLPCDARITKILTSINLLKQSSQVLGLSQSGVPSHTPQTPQMPPQLS